MSNDTELFELCKSVYEKTGWGGTLAFYEQTAGIPEGEPYIAYPELERRWGLFGSQELKKHTPLYTTDYLLEKLPSVISIDDWFNLTNELGRWFAGYTRIKSESTTPLKALLKLALALNKAGIELKEPSDV